MAQKRILIIEDEEAISDLISFYFEKEGFVTKVANSGESGIDLVDKFNPDLILLDLMLPDTNGFDLCKKISSKYIIPIIMLTAKSDTIDKILGMELGADDYITKPFDIREVIVRIKTIFRRIDLTSDAYETNDSKVIKLDSGTEIYEEKHEVLKNSEKIEFTNREYELLLFLAKNKGKVISREVLLDKVWGYDYIGDSRTVDIHVQRIRKKLDETKGRSLIETVFGVGYKLLE
ncbi:MAG: DNA-binding response regulator [Clostridia bacterium]|jgi:DNA-binding response OmpR family regulator|nr:DNA-binding response regulator [Clostridia bacterium]